MCAVASMRSTCCSCAGGPPFQGACMARSQGSARPIRACAAYAHMHTRLQTCLPSKCRVACGLTKNAANKGCMNLADWLHCMSCFSLRSAIVLWSSLHLHHPPSDVWNHAALRDPESQLQHGMATHEGNTGAPRAGNNVGLCWILQR